MTMKLYVGNLPHSYSEEDLKGVFAEYPSITSCKLIIDRDTGRSKGFGFVEFSSKDDANKAIAKFHGFSVEGRALVVNEARPLQPRREGGGREDSYNKRRSYR